jgi:hypothetical protein
MSESRMPEGMHCPVCTFVGLVRKTAEATEIAAKAMTWGLALGASMTKGKGMFMCEHHGFMFAHAAEVHGAEVNVDKRYAPIN